MGMKHKTFRNDYHKSKTRELSLHTQIAISTNQSVGEKSCDWL